MARWSAVSDTNKTLDSDSHCVSHTKPRWKRRSSPRTRQRQTNESSVSCCEICAPFMLECEFLVWQKIPPHIHRAKFVSPIIPFLIFPGSESSWWMLNFTRGLSVYLKFPVWLVEIRDIRMIGLSQISNQKTSSTFLTSHFHITNIIGLNDWKYRNVSASIKHWI